MNQSFRLTQRHCGCRYRKLSDKYLIFFLVFTLAYRYHGKCGIAEEPCQTVPVLGGPKLGLDLSFPALAIRTSGLVTLVGLHPIHPVRLGHHIMHHASWFDQSFLVDHIYILFFCSSRLPQAHCSRWRLGDLLAPVLGFIRESRGLVLHNDGLCER